MITVVKQNPLGKTMIKYTGEVVERLPHGIVVSATWTLPVRDLGYARFEPGDQVV